MLDQLTVGAPLPRAADAYTATRKWHGWILAGRGHGAEWAYVLHVRQGDAAEIWLAISRAIQDAPVRSIRDKEEHGVTCDVTVTIAVNGRSAPIATVWHYAYSGAAPKLVTAYPTP